MLDLAGRPASGVAITATLVSNNSGSLISNNSGSLISHNGSKYRVADAALATVTDSDGYFKLDLPTDGHYNFEARVSDQVKAIAQAVIGGAPVFEMRLAYTGTVRGKVSAPDAPTVSDFLGVDVYIPGTSYLAKTDASGNFQLDHVPVGAFTLVASRQGLGLAVLDNVVVTASHSTSVPSLPLSVAAPAITSISPPNAGAGAAVVLSGTHFGASSGETFAITFGGVQASGAQRLSDQQIQVTVPLTANSGGVVATVAGLPSAVAPFSVLQSLNLVPWVTYLPQGRTASFSVVAYDTVGAPVSNPVVGWSVGGPALSRLSTQSVSASASGTGSLTVTSGQLLASMPIQVTHGAALSTLAGTGVLGFQDGPAGSAQFNVPDGLASGPDGSLYVAEWDGQRIRRIGPDGMVTTLAGSGNGTTQDGQGTGANLDHPRGLAVDSAGTLWVTEWETGQIRKITASGAVTTLPLSNVQLYSPYGIAVDAQGTLYVAEVAANRITKVAPDGSVSGFVGGTLGDANGTGSAAQFRAPHGLAFDVDGSLLVAEYGGNRIRRVTMAGVVTTVAGASQSGMIDGLGTSARFWGPHDIAVDANGVIWVSDTENQLIRRIATDTRVTTVAGRGIAGFADGEALSGALRFPRGIAVLPSGDLAVSDCSNHRVRTFMK